MDADAIETAQREARKRARAQLETLRSIPSGTEDQRTYRDARIAALEKHLAELETQGFKSQASYLRARIADLEAVPMGSTAAQIEHRAHRVGLLKAQLAGLDE